MLIQPVLARSDIVAQGIVTPVLAAGCWARVSHPVGIHEHLGAAHNLDEPRGILELQRESLKMRTRSLIVARRLVRVRTANPRARRLWATALPV